MKFFAWLLSHRNERRETTSFVSQSLRAKLEFVLETVGVEEEAITLTWARVSMVILITPTPLERSVA